MRVCDLFDELHYNGQFICYSSCDGRILFRTFGKKYKEYLHQTVNKTWVSIETNRGEYSDRNIGYATLCFYVTPLNKDLPKKMQQIKRLE